MSIFESNFSLKIALFSHFCRFSKKHFLDFLIFDWLQKRFITSTTELFHAKSTVIPSSLLPWKFKFIKFSLSLRRLGSRIARRPSFKVKQRLELIIVWTGTNTLKLILLLHNCRKITARFWFMICAINLKLS